MTLTDLPDSRLFWFVLGMLCMALMCGLGALCISHFCDRDQEEPEEEEEP